MIRYSITPVPKPRMTQRDRWKQRACVVRYREFKDQARAAGVRVPDCGARMIFIMPMPKSWSAKKRNAMRGMPHQQKPDSDNLVKAVMDAVLEEDSGVFHVDGLKFWGDVGEIIIQQMPKALRFDGSQVIFEEAA